MPTEPITPGAWSVYDDARAYAADQRYQEERAKPMWYILERDEETDIVCVPDGNDPLYGRGSWNLARDVYAGPYMTYAEAADIAAPLTPESD
jgi:hypothetical protein